MKRDQSTKSSGAKGGTPEADEPTKPSAPAKRDIVKQSKTAGKTMGATDNTAPVLASEIVRIGKDELNLIEHPFATMWDKEGNTAVIHHEWDARHPVTGKTLRASWRVEGSPTMGLPKPNDERVYLVLLELTREAHFQNQAVFFTRHDLVKRLGWTHNDKSYQMLYDAFERLKAVSITAKNAFWEPRAQSFRNIGFSIIDNFDILNEKPGRKSKYAEQAELPMSYFRWNEVMFHSFQSGYMRTLDLGLALSLKGDIALRLYRYLDKKTYDGRRSFEIELAALCERHLGMRPARYPSKHKERLKGAHDELIQRGVLDGVVYEPMKSKKAEKVCYSFPAKATSLSQKTDENTDGNDADRNQSATPRRENSDEAELHRNRSEPLEPADDMLQRMLELKISPEVAQTLLQNVPAETLQEQLDCLDDREPRDRAATFIKAVREGWQLPGKYLERLEAQNRVQEAKAHQDTQKAQQAAQEAKARAEKATQEEESARLDTLWEQLDDLTRQTIEAQARQRLGVLGQSGRAQGALVAMRRNLLRERLAPKE